jgi:UDP-glucose 4-epimerase
MSNYLVTGGCGFIGSHLVKRLMAAGDGVRILDNVSTGQSTRKPADAELIIGDVCNPALVTDAMQGMDGCFHLAAVASVERGNQDWLGTHRTNLTGSITVFDAARPREDRAGIPVVYASSAAGLSLPTGPTSSAVNSTRSLLDAPTGCPLSDCACSMCTGRVRTRLPLIPE